MIRLFGYTGILVVLSLTLALVTGSPVYRAATVITASAVIGLYWFLRRSLPRLSGELTVDGLLEPVEVYRDERGVPHIYARNLHDLYLAQGYVAAQDRIWQMELNRRAASGRLAELLGEAYLSRDIHVRTLGLRRVAEDSLKEYSAAAMAHLEAYAAGVNAYLKEGRLPPEFSLLRCTPEPWTPVDSLATAKLIAYELSNNWGDGLFRVQLIQAVGVEKAAALLGNYPEPATLQALIETDLPDLDELFHLATHNLQTVEGSNGWVIAGSRTQSGYPLLGSDLHVAPRIPTAWHQAHLVGPDRTEVTGVTYPGIPGVMLGHTRDFAWSLSGPGVDTQDLVLERANPDDLDQFAFQNRWETAERTVVEIRVCGRPEPVRHEVVTTRHGPVLARNGASAVVLRSPVLQPSAEIACLLDMNRARTWPEFRAAARGLKAPAQAILYAGRDGTIARFLVGSIPTRRGADAGLPVPGWTGQHEWTGLISPDDLPEVLNPAEGFLVAADQSLTTHGSVRISSPWAPPYRAERLADRLRASQGWSRERGEDLLLDTVNLQARRLLQLLLGSLNEGLRQGAQPESLNDVEKRALLLISGWDHDEKAGSAGALLWQQWHLFLLEGIFRPQMGLGLFDRFLATRCAIPMADQVLADVAAGHENLWLGREGEKGLPRIALRSFRRAVALLAARHGPRPEQWRWGQEHQIRFGHSLSRRYRFLSHFLNLGPYPTGGSETTVCANGHSRVEPFGVRSASSYRRVVDMGLPEEGVAVSAPGVSGHPLSPFAGDQLVIWQQGGYFPQPLRHPEIRRFPRLLLNPPPERV